LPISGALLISKEFDSVHVSTNISRHAVSPLLKRVVQIDSFSFLNACEQPTLIGRPHVAFVCVPYSVLLAFVRPMRELIRIGPPWTEPISGREWGRTSSSPISESNICGVLTPFDLVEKNLKWGWRR